MATLELVTAEKEQAAARKQEEEGRKLTRYEITNRVHQLRKELEAAKQRYDGALFDNFIDGIPPSLDVVNVNREPYGVVYHLSPLLQSCVEHHGEVKSDDVFDLFFFSTQTAYEVGMLAGAIYADSPTATIDRFERGLVTALAACHWISKEEERP